VKESGSITEKKRLFYLDLLRAIACLSVVMIHVSADFVTRGTKGPDFWLGNLMDSVSRAGVPLFVMISGALMLDEGYEFTRKKWLGHIGRMAAFYVVWSTVYCLIYRVWGLVARGEKVRILGAVMQVVSGHYHLWFVPMIICMYLLVPLLRRWVGERNVRSVERFLAIATVLLFVVPQIVEIMIRETGGNGFLNGFLDDLNVAYSVRYVVYFILGWYLNRGVKRWKPVCRLGVFGVCMTFAGTCVATLLLGMNTYPFYRNFTVNVLLYSAAIFTLCRMRFRQPAKPDGIMQRAVRWIGKCSLGIYAVHLYVISKLMTVFGGLHVVVALPLIFVLTVALSAIIPTILHRVPILKKIV